MKKSSIIALVAGALVVCSLVGWNMGGVSVEQRIFVFQSDLNRSDRRNLYQDFIPTVADYAVLKTPSSTFNTLFPPPPPSYSLTVMSESMPSKSNPSSGVIVQVFGPDGVYPSPYFLKCVMATDNGYNWMIQTLSISTVPDASPGWTLLYQ